MWCSESLVSLSKSSLRRGFLLLLGLVLLSESGVLEERCNLFLHQVRELVAPFLWSLHYEEALGAGGSGQHGRKGVHFAKSTIQLN